jgi:hypothetical protein
MSSTQDALERLSALLKEIQLTAKEIETMRAESMAAWERFE